MLGKNSFLLKSIDYKKIGFLSAKLDKKLIDRKSTITKLINLSKLIRFSSSKGKSLPSSLWPNKRVLTCFNKRYKRWSELEKTFFNVEIYLKDRFKEDSSPNNQKLRDFVSSLNKSVRHDYFF